MRTFAISIARRQAESLRKPPSARIAVTTISTSTAKRASFAPPNMPSAATAASPCSQGTSRPDGAIVKTAGVDESILKFEGPRARV